MVRWIFDNDEHFLKSCGITPYPEYQDDCDELEKERVKNFMSTLLNEHGAEFAYFDEYPQEDPFGYDMLAHGEESPILSLDEQLDEEQYKLDVMSQLSTAISEFLTFSNEEALLKFVKSQLN